VAAAGEFAVVLGDRVPIDGGDLGRVGVADGTVPVLIELAAQLQFQHVHACDEMLVHLLDQGRIPADMSGRSQSAAGQTPLRSDDALRPASQAATSHTQASRLPQAGVEQGRQVSEPSKLKPMPDQKLCGIKLLAGTPHLISKELAGLIHTTEAGMKRKQHILYRKFHRSGEPGFTV
jgi:hypothetical protein